ncbi:MAG: hypothetical protein ACE5J2_01685 [Nitrososphaerales archaeon]
MAGLSEDWLSKLILKQETSLRKEYEQKYLPECKGKGISPLRYAPWRQRKMEPRVLELLIEEDKVNHQLQRHKLDR